MRVEVNGEVRHLDPGMSLRTLIETIAATARGTAAVVDGEVVPRGDWDRCSLRDGQRVELITAVQGG